MKVGVMIAGLRGATASTLIACALGTDRDEMASFLMTERGAAKRLPLARLDELVFGGWDTIDEPWSETLSRHRVLSPIEAYLPALEAVRVYPAVALLSDHAAVTGETTATTLSGAAILRKLRDDIADFRRASGAEALLVIHLGAPALLPPAAEWPEDADTLIDALERGRFASAAPYYLAAAMLEGAAIVDYTASPTLEMPGFEALARRERAPYAGRDGSTGQTLLKSVLAETFATRRLKILGWYSANILGNHDGWVLEDGRYSEVKKHDKTALLETILGYPVDHLVDIRYYPPAGDDKEALDAIDFEVLGGARGRLRIDWQCSDSRLATPPLIDLIRLLAYLVGKERAGVQPQLGVFFKNPLGTSERRYLRLAAELERWLEAEASAAGC